MSRRLRSPGTSDTLADTKVSEPVELPSLGASGELVVPRSRLPAFLGLTLLAILVAGFIIFVFGDGEKPETGLMTPIAVEEPTGTTSELDEPPQLDGVEETEAVVEMQPSEVESETLPSATMDDPVPNSEVAVTETPVDESSEASEATGEEAEDDTTEVAERRRDRSRRRRPPPEPEPDPPPPPVDITPDEQLEQPEDTQPPEQEDRTIRETLQHI